MSFCGFLTSVFAGLSNDPIPMSKNDTRMWGGRSSEPTDEFVQSFTASVAFDRRLAFADIEGSRAHATMLGNHATDQRMCSTIVNRD